METGVLKIRYRGESLEIEYLLRPGSGKTILYLHGLGCSKDDFKDATAVAELRSHTVAAFDFPGCGNSPYPERMRLDIDDLVEITNIVVSRLSLNDLVIIGHSMGGLVGLLYIQRYGYRVKGFINVEGNLAPEDCFFSRKVIECSLGEFVEIFLPKVIHTLSQSENRGFRKHLEILEQRSSPRAIFDYCPSLVSYSDKGNLLDHFHRLPVPKLFILGSENATLSYLPMLRQQRCPVAEIPHSNHFPGYDNPEEYYRAISHFLIKNTH